MNYEAIFGTKNYFSNAIIDFQDIIKETQEREADKYEMIKFAHS